MFGNKEFIGLAVQDNAIRIARLKAEGNKLTLVKLDRFSLVEKLKTGTKGKELQEHAMESVSNEEADSIFGLEEPAGGQEEEDFEDDLNFDDLEDISSEEEELGLDMVDESEEAQSNELLLYNILTEINPKKVNLGLNVPAGSTIYQVIRDTNFNEVKTKDLVQDLEEKLESIYGEPKSQDNYSYEVREDGSLLLASLEEESPTLQLANSVRELYSGKLMIQEIIPDEVSLVGLVRSNYSLEPDEMTGVIQLGKENCRVIFMKGEEVWLVSPLITEGTESKTFLNTIFSKVLFQLDTGEVPSLDRILLANNTQGTNAVSFFKDNFPDVQVENLSLLPELVDTEHVDPSSVPSFTTAIGAALAAAGSKKISFPKVSFLPAYVIDRQKIFKLQWHGIFLLFLIFLTPITFNYFYSQNVQQISTLTGNVQTMESQIRQLNPTVEKANALSQELTQITGKLALLDTLTNGSKEWTAKMGILNEGMDNIANSWITSLSTGEGDTFIEGYTLYRNRIPRIVNIFEDATLLSVSNEEVRETSIYRFNISIKQFAASDSLYSPKTPVEVRNLLGEE